MAMAMPEVRGRMAEEGEPAERVAGLVLALEVKQQAMGLNGAAMARELGVTRNYWYRLRTGNRDPGKSLIARVLEKWPGEFEHLLSEVVRRRASGARRGSAS